MAVENQVDRLHSGRPLRSIPGAIPIRLPHRPDVLAKTLQLLCGEVDDRIGGGCRLAPLGRVTSAPSPPLTELRVVAVYVHGFEGVASRGLLCIAGAGGEIEGLRDPPPRAAPAPPATSLLYEPVLRQGLEMPRHVAGAVVQQFSCPGGREGTFRDAGLREGRCAWDGQRHACGGRRPPCRASGTGRWRARVRSSNAAQRRVGSCQPEAQLDQEPTRGLSHRALAPRPPVRRSEPRRWVLAALRVRPAGLPEARRQAVTATDARDTPFLRPLITRSLVTRVLVTSTLVNEPVRQTLPSRMGPPSARPCPVHTRAAHRWSPHCRRFSDRDGAPLRSPSMPIGATCGPGGSIGSGPSTRSFRPMTARPRSAPNSVTAASSSATPSATRSKTATAGSRPPPSG